MSQTNQHPETKADNMTETPVEGPEPQAAGEKSAAKGEDGLSDVQSPIDPLDADHELTLPEDDYRITELENEVADAKDKMLRALAEVENIRRRSQREREDTAKYAVSNFAKDMLSVADNLKRALDSVPAEARESNELLANMLTGVEATERELQRALEKHNIHKIEPMDVPFDPNLHEAMFEVDAPDKPAGTVVQLLEAGYVIHDRVLRPARVGVSKGGPKPQKVDQEV